jgi:hypothetical protein
MIENIAQTAVIERCLAAASHCMQLGNDRRANAWMKAEFREVAREVAHLRLSGETKVGLFLLPMEEELVNHHGLEIGRRLYTDFVDAFWIQTWTILPLDEERLERETQRLTDWHLRAQTSRAIRHQILLNHNQSRIPQN